MPSGLCRPNRALFRKAPPRILDAIALLRGLRRSGPWNLTAIVPEDLSAVPMWTAMLFLVHPLATETVTYISGRASGLAAFWYLAAFSLYVTPAADASGKGAARRTDAAALLCFAFALASK